MKMWRLIEILERLPKNAEVKIFNQRNSDFDNLTEDDVYYNEKLNEIQIV